MRINTISDKAFVLSRTNYGETDRVLNILSSNHGKLSVIAKGVRKGKSKLAGGIELFAENELVLLKGKSDLYIVTSSRMKNYFGNIAKDIDVSTYAYECLKTISKLTPEGAGEEYYQPLLNLMKALDESRIPLGLIKIWFDLKILKNLGSQPNFETDHKNKKLSDNSNFEYDFDRHCFFSKRGAPYRQDHIKVLRHLSKASTPVEIRNLNDDTVAEIEHLTTTLLADHIR